MATMCVSLVFALLVTRTMGFYLEDTSTVDGEIIYDANTYLVEMPSSCKGQPYCFDEGENYPHKKIEDLLTHMSDSKDQMYFGSRVEDTHEQDCPANSTEDPIFYITDKNDKVRVVVQSKDRFPQIYTVRWCSNEGLITSDTPHFLKNTTLSKFDIECITTRMDFDFFVLSDEVDPETGGPMMETAKAKGGIPVCCRCRMR